MGRAFLNYHMEYNSVLDVVFSSESSTEPCTLAEVKSWAKVDLTDDDTLITELIKTARKQCEGFSGISLITRTVTAYIKNTAGDLELPYGPVVSFTSLTDVDGDAITSDNYILRGGGFKYLVEPYDDYLVAVYTTGFTTLPTQYKTGVLQQFTHLYENRGDNSQTDNLSDMAKQTLTPYRRVV